MVTPGDLELLGVGKIQLISPNSSSPAFFHFRAPSFASKKSFRDTDMERKGNQNANFATKVHRPMLRTNMPSWFHCQSIFGAWAFAVLCILKRIPAMCSALSSRSLKQGVKHELLNQKTLSQPTPLKISKGFQTAARDGLPGCWGVR